MCVCILYIKENDLVWNEMACGGVLELDEWHIVMTPVSSDRLCNCALPSLLTQTEDYENKVYTVYTVYECSSVQCITMIWMHFLSQTLLYTCNAKHMQCHIIFQRAMSKIGKCLSLVERTTAQVCWRKMVGKPGTVSFKILHTRSILLECYCYTVLCTVCTVYWTVWRCTGMYNLVGYCWMF